MPIGRDIAVVSSVKIDQTDVERVSAQGTSDFVEDQLDCECALRTAKPPKGGIALQVRLNKVAMNRHLRQPVRVVKMADRASHDRRRQISRKPCIADQADLNA